MQEIYLDNNATTRPLPEVRGAVLEVLADGFGNPSSAHSAGERARSRLQRARDSTAALIGAQAEQIVFTSGGTESNGLALMSAFEAVPGPRRLITTSTEHSSILETARALEGRGIEVIYLPVARSGLVDCEQLSDAILPGDSFVSCHWVNNETGIVQPIEEIARRCKENGVPLHTDAAQAIGKVPIDLADTSVDFLSLSGHKLHAPQGVGAVYCRNPRSLQPRIFGGPQEGGVRAGTENLPGIVGLGVALRLRRQRFEEVNLKMAGLRDVLERAVVGRIPDVEVNGCRENRVANTTSLLFGDLDGQALTARLDRLGILCSQSSACTNQRPEPSYVLRAMGLSEEQAYASIRFSLSEETTEAEVERAGEAIADEVEKLRYLLHPSRAQTLSTGAVPRYP